MNSRSLFISVALAGTLFAGHAATLTVTTAASTGAGSLSAALAAVQAGDTIAFNIPGDGPHLIATPPGGHPLITAHNVTIDGYTQPGSAPNSNGILAANNALIRIVLDSRNGNSRLMDFPGDTPNDQTGYGDTEAAVLGVLSATNVTIRGLSILSVPGVDNVDIYGISFAKGANGRISGCWIGIAPDGETLAAPKDGVTGFRYRRRDENNAVLESILTSGIVIGVPVGATDAPGDFNVFCGIPAIPVIIEGENLRFSGNFFNVFPDGLRDYNPALDGLFGTFEGNIEIGRAGNNTVIGVDGDGVNDEHERNVFSGVVPPSLGGYAHNIEFYGQTPGTNIVFAGNYFGVGVDGATRFTNGVPVLNAPGGSATYRFGSNLDGVSDDLEANVVFNNWPPDLFPAFEMGANPPALNFFSQLATGGSVNARGNVLINNFPFPASPLRSGGTFLTDYYAKALADAASGVEPVISEQSTGQRLKGTVPAPNAEHPTVIVDLYVADAEGIQTGIDAGIPELPNGFVQGRRYVASFVVDGPADLDPAPSQFEFDISGLGGGNLTLTANYSRDPAGTANPRLITGPFSAPRAIAFVPGSAESAGLTRIVPDRVLFDTDTPNFNNWEPTAGVIGTSLFVVEANTFSDDGTFSTQRYGLAFQPVGGGTPTLGDAFFTDAGAPFRGQINLSRQDGNPGRVAGDRRPGAVNLVAGGEASPHGVAGFNSDNRWNLGYDRLDNGRYGTIQMSSVNPATLAQTPLSRALDSANGRLTSGEAPGPQISRFGGDIAVLDNGNIVSVVEDRSNVLHPGTAAVATIFAPDGTVVKDSFLVAPGDLWSNAASFRGGFCVRVAGVLYFFDNAGNATGSTPQGTSGGNFDPGRGDGTRLAAHIHSPYVFLAGRGREGATAPIRIAAWDARDRSFVALAEVSEPGLLDAASDRVNLAVDALNRVTVAYETKVRAEQQLNQTLVRVLAFNAAARRFDPLTPSFFAFVNFGDDGFRTIRPSIAMTTRQILIAAKGEINKANNVAAGPDSLPQTTFYTVLAHPAPADDPTPPAGGGATLSIARDGANVRLEYTGTLESTGTLAPANWQAVAGASSPYTVSPGGPQQYYRSRQ